MVLEADLVKALNLKTIIAAENGRLNIEVSNVNRPGLQLAGYWDFFGYERPQLLGMVEMTYLSMLDKVTRHERLTRFFSYDIPCIIIARSIPCFDEMLVLGAARKIPIYSAAPETVQVEVDLISFLRDYLAPRETMHGVLVNVYGSGLLITGESGVGKSETAIELVKRGHRLIADDAVELRRISNRSILGTAPANIRHFIELRGIGIINVAHVFGIGSVRNSVEVELVVQFEPWDKSKNYDRTGLDTQYFDILGVQIPSMVIPVMPGRNLAVILETAAINNRTKEMGYNAAQELLTQLGLQDDVPL